MPGAACDPEVKVSRMSVMMLSEHLNTIFNTESGSGDTPAPCPPPAAIPTPGLVANLPQASSASLTLADIRRCLSAAGFLYLYTSDSQTLMQDWIRRDISSDQLVTAIGEIANDRLKQPTPAALDRCLRCAESNRKRRGRVAL